MSDPRLNSIHLDSFRREEFRRARGVLMGTIGEQTRNLQCAAPADDDATARGHTFLQSYAGRLPPGYDYVLVEKDAVYQLKIGLNTIGRLSDNDVVLPDPYLSRRHCAIVVHASEGCEIHDVASKNGTFVNGQKINGPTPINSGDEIRMCDRQLVFIRRVDLPDSRSSDTMVG